MKYDNWFYSRKNLNQEDYWTAQQGWFGRQEEIDKLTVKIGELENELIFLELILKF